MKKFILAAITVILSSSICDLYAYNHCYVYTDDSGFPLYGALRRVSPNGRWAVGGDEDEFTGCFIVDTTDPQYPLFNTEGNLLDVDNNGLAVGIYYEMQGYARYKRAAIFRDNEWIQLPLPEEVMGQSAAVAISADSKTIAGHALCASSDPSEPGRYFPVVWRLNETTGEYDLYRLYNNLYLPGSYGFFVYDMTPNAKYICGTHSLDFSDTIAIMLDVETGEATSWHSITIEDWYFEAAHASFPTMFVDGVMDGFSDTMYFNGRFNYATDRYLFGTHAVVTALYEDGEGEITNYATVYDIENHEFIDGPTGLTYMCGTGPDEVFANNGTLTTFGSTSLVEDIVNTGDEIAGIYSIDDSGRILSGSYITFTKLGDIVESPVLVILEEPAVIGGLQDVKVGKGYVISVIDRTINISGAKESCIYRIDGTLLSRASSVSVAPGIYIVVADGVSEKIVVK